MPGDDETGQSLAHIEEVAAALQGRYRGALRIRIRDKPPPPIYSISRGTGLRVFSAMPVIVDNHVAGVIYLPRARPSNIFQHLYEEKGKFILAGDRRARHHHGHRADVSAHHRPSDA